LTYSKVLDKMDHHYRMKPRRRGIRNEKQDGEDFMMNDKRSNRRNKRRAGTW
jgi:hypothetical protein